MFKIVCVYAHGKRRDAGVGTLFSRSLHHGGGGGGPGVKGKHAISKTIIFMLKP